MEDEVMTMDDIFIEACEDDEDIELGYFSENLKYILDKEIDDEINNKLTSIFDSEEGTNVGAVVSAMLLDLADDLKKSGSGYGEYMRYISPLTSDETRCEDVCVDDTYFDSDLYNWCSDETEDDRIYWKPEEMGDSVNPGYDSIFGAD